MQQARCRVCGHACSTTQPGDYLDISCSNCGDFRLSGTAEAMLFGGDCTMAPKKVKFHQAMLSHMIWKGQKPGALFEVDSSIVEHAREILPYTPFEQLELLVMVVGEELCTTPGETVTWVPGALRAKIGATKDTDVNYIAQEGKRLGLFDNRDGLRLTMEGWQKYDAIKKGLVQTNRAFMAMQFKDNEAGIKIVNDYFKPAVLQAGFELELVTDRLRAGLIDDKIRVDIKNSMFAVVDLTYNNNGAYWEAGFAEGLGKRVFYTCNKKFFDESRTHFDCNHQHTILWDETDPRLAAEQLKDTIRNEFYPDARKED